MQKVAVTVLIVQMCHTDKILSLYIMIQGLLVNVFTNNMLLPALLHMIQIAAKRLNASQESEPCGMNDDSVALALAAREGKP